LTKSASYFIIYRCCKGGVTLKKVIAKLQPAPENNGEYHVLANWDGMAILYSDIKPGMLIRNKKRIGTVGHKPANVLEIVKPRPLIYQGPPRTLGKVVDLNYNLTGQKPGFVDTDTVIITIKPVKPKPRRGKRGCVAVISPLTGVFYIAEKPELVRIAPFRKNWK